MFIVDDNPDDLELIIRTLRKHHLTESIQVAHDGAEALGLLVGDGATEPISGIPKVIRLDLKLPKVNGLEVVQCLKSAPRTCAIPVVLFSSSDEERDVQESYRLGVDSYVIKPTDYAQYTEVVRQIGAYWLQVNRPSSPLRSS
jgi:CheY-like chemotaxis protein